MALQIVRSGLPLTKLSLARYSHAAANKLSHVLQNGPLADLTTLDNGIRVITEKTDSLSTTIGVYLDGGSSAETKTTNGITYFLEHMLFKGSKKHPAKQLEKDVYKLGGLLNSFTDRESNGYFLTLAPQDAAKGIELLSDLLQNPNLNADDIENTRKAILNELDQCESDHQQVTMDYLHSVTYQQVPLGFSKFGPTENIKRFGLDDLKAAIDLVIKGPRLVVAASGNVNHDDVVKTVEKSMKGMSADYELSAIPGFPTNRYTGSDIRVRDDSMSHAHVAFCVEGPGHNNPDHLVMDIASCVMGNWDLSHGGGANVSSYMGMISASEHLAQSFRSFNLKYKDTALFGSYFVGERMQLQELLWQLQYQWKRMVMQVANNEIQLGKNILMSKLIREREDSVRNAHSLARDVYRHGRRVTLEELHGKIKQIDSAKMHSVAENYIWDRCPSVSALGPVENLPHYEEIRMSMSWVRY